MLTRRGPPSADPGVGHLQRRVIELDAELASFRAQVAAVTVERDAERCDALTVSGLFST